VLIYHERRTFLKGIFLLAMSSGPLIQACGRSSVEGKNSAVSEGKEKMETAKDLAFRSTEKPPIDLLLPAKMETATFALG